MMNKRPDPAAVDLLEGLGIADPAALEDFRILNRIQLAAANSPQQPELHKITSDSIA